jgi:hypothetical protein
MMSPTKSGWRWFAGVAKRQLFRLAVITTLFATGYFLYGEYLRTAVFVVIDILFIFLLSRAWKHLRK